MNLEANLTQHLELKSVVDFRCRGCPAVIASEAGKSALQIGSCDMGFTAVNADIGEQGCKKGPIDSSLMLIITREHRLI